MLLLIVWLAVAAFAVLVLGILAYGLFGAVGRLLREMTALQRDVTPVVGELQASLAAAARTRTDRADA